MFLNTIVLEIIDQALLFYKVSDRILQCLLDIIFTALSLVLKGLAYLLSLHFVYLHLALINFKLEPRCFLLGRTTLIAS